MAIDWKQYDPKPFFDELIAKPGKPRKPAKPLTDYLSSLDDTEIQSRKTAADSAILEMGISFTVYTEGENIDRAWPFDIIPRVITKTEWERVTRGLEQRLTALNMFINDIYNKQQIFKDKVVPRYVLKQSKNFREQCVGITPPHGVWAHICGTDLVRDGKGDFYVLEDNLRVPSGVSYMLENRQVTKRVFPELFESSSILPVDEYPTQLFDMLASISPRPQDYPEIAVLTPGIYNSAYFEHSFLAQRMGAELVEGADLVVGDDDCVYMRTIDGLERVDVIYRRIDDEFLDPEVFNPESMLGVPGLMRAWRKGNVGLANAPGAGVADDKVMYAFVPEVIRYYLDEEPILPNVPTYLCVNEKDREYVLDHLDELVVKPANESGGYGMLVGPHATKKQRAEFAQLIQKDPRNYIAQPTLALSVAPTLCGDDIEPRHLDLRPFILQGVRTDVTAGGLTRVAMRKGSLVVNSSQGGGSKDTWIVDEEN
ncbi:MULTISPECIES: circularly permuted type 2 ATP-grasp protein [unclassified Thioalkalivibrio]|uniref:circularly permuted type 2 ATP-grasp protein n=1 Tax=unclassified Thioalkalivibrio TaxID=2621013 RepID=UPI00035CEFC3|nr:MULTISPECIES: circularly permuted type 2 ATP-grasp protein [unclassified Thioalkalivibrio]